MSRRLWLIVPAWIAFAIDVGLTLRGQPADYWNGQYDLALEFNPLARPLLVAGPWVFAGAALAGAIGLSLIVVLWRHPLANLAAAIFAVSHAIGGCSWLVAHGAWGWIAIVIYLITLSRIARWCWRRGA